MLWLKGEVVGVEVGMKDEKEERRGGGKDDGV